MNTQNFTTSIPVDTIWHTNWGFCVRCILGGQTQSFFLDFRIPGLHRAYVERYVSGTRNEHADRANPVGTPSKLLPGTTAHIKARIVETLDDIPLDPVHAGETVRSIYAARIASNPRGREELQAECDRLCVQFQRMIEGTLKSVIDIPGVVGISQSLEIRA